MTWYRRRSWLRVAFGVPVLVRRFSAAREQAALAEK
jgi:hypothetical protein